MLAELDELHTEAMPAQGRAPIFERGERSRVEGMESLEPIGLHELRHTCASIFIAAGVNAKALST
jgi:hypothetical protein